MDFRFTPQDETFRKEVRDYLLARLPSDWNEKATAGAADEGEHFDFARDNAKAIQRDKGWLTMAWPKDFGGLGATHWQQAIFNWETNYHRFPIAVGAGISLAGPTIMIHGTEEQKQTWLPRIASADEMWCQLFTEPGAGSDLASLQTRAVEDGDSYNVNGQKIFTSGAHRAQFGWAGFRTDTAAAKHRGISMFIVPMETPGITIRPLINMTGVHAQNEVFFDDARIPRENLIGEKNRGWYMMATSLDFERSGVGRYAIATKMLEELVEYARTTPQNGRTVAQDPNVRNKLANMAIEIEVGKWLAFRIIHMQSSGIVPNREASESKTWGSEMTQRLANVGMQVLGLYGNLRATSQLARLGGRFEHLHKLAIFFTIGAGSSEVQRNIIAGRGLGLPR